MKKTIGLILILITLVHADYLRSDTTTQRRRRGQEVYDAVAFEDTATEDQQEVATALMDKFTLITSTIEIESALPPATAPTTTDGNGVLLALEAVEEEDADQDADWTVTNVTTTLDEAEFGETFDNPEASTAPEYNTTLAPSSVATFNTTVAPSPTGTMEPTLVPTDAPTQLPFGPVRYVGNDHDGFFYERYPLGVCLGDCDTDDDCQKGLYCFQRSKLGPVPHCTGGEELDTTVDFCAWNTSFPPPQPPSRPIGAFQIKLYWEQGYLWQNETFDRRWCMISDFDGYPGNGECHYGDDSLPCSPDQVYIGKCLDDDPRQWFTLMDVGDTYSRNKNHRECLIGTVDPDDVFAEPKRCLKRQYSQLYLSDNCNPADERQRFFALTGSFTPSYFDKSRFEISQYQGYTHDNCVTNAHHPKSGEVVEFHVCDAARNSDDETSYWQLLY